MTSERYERVLTAIRRQEPDRVPWALWGHFPAVPFLKYYSWEKANRDGGELAKAHIALLNALDYKMDLLKVTPFYRFMAYHWGSKFRFTNNNEVVETVDVLVKDAKDWQKLWVLDPKRELREQIRSVSILSREIGRGMPFIFTVPSPLVQAIHGIGSPDRVYTDMQMHPDLLREGLETITQTCIDFARACIDEGATGIFFGIGGGGELWSRLTQDQLEQYALPYDLKVLDSVKHAAITLLHICSTETENPQQDGRLMEQGWFKQYPVDAINWWDANFTSCATAKRVYGDRFCILAGVDHKHVMRQGSPQQVEKQVELVIDAASSGGGFILGPGCTLHQDTTLENMNAVGRAIEKYGRSRR
jgi:uroporphyrinogen decarboxylase